MAKPPNIRVPGQSIPSGYAVGRTAPGRGDQQLVDMSTLAAQLAATGNVAAPSGAVSLTAIADDRILANVNGSTAIPIATAWAAPAAGLTITGAASAITFALANDLAALEGLGSTGLAARTAADTWAQRTITGTASRLTVTQGDGIAGNPTLDISTSYAGQATITTLGTIATGTWQATKIGLAYGGVNADLSATGGANQVLQQASAGAAITVGTIAAAGLSNGASGSGAVALVNTPTLITPRLTGYTVAGLPAAGTQGRIAYVTDALAPAFLTIIVGGGAIVSPVFDNGTNWVSY